MTDRVGVYDGKHVAHAMMPNDFHFSHGVATTIEAAPGRKHALTTQKTKSEPSTPHQRPQYTMDPRTSPQTSQPPRDGSPRSSNSDQSRTPPATRRLIGGCKFETGMAQARRRVPYSLGPDKLMPEPIALKRQLGVSESKKLTAEMQELYQQLLPSPESEERRSKFVNKLESLLQSRWPGTDIKVRVFGSTGNRLGTGDSDVDICITTDCKEIENVCLIAELLERNGMQRIVCVSSAKIPIVKAWDPEFQVACDMNVNNPIALENTHMIRSYVLIDERVRPLAMIIKYWAKRRILNDAALGGTLSSYTWICMVLNFLQTREPPILPALQRQSTLEPVILNGVNVAFVKDVQAYKGFGTENKSSLGELLFEFFRYFGHEFDYEKNALSVRLGEVIPKSQKAWHLLQDNRLCVEEPFNISRNLANTADDTSMRGIHLDLRRAFKLAMEGDLAKCCEEYIPVAEEYRQTATFIHPSAARPIIPQAPTQVQHLNPRNIRNSYRGPRTTNRNSGSRRASNPAARNPNYLHDLPFQMTPQELQLQAQHQQHLLHDQLFQQYQYLQLQEQELRMQLYQQNLRQRGIMASQTFQQPPFSNDNGVRLPMSPSVYQSRFGNSSPFLNTTSLSTGIITNPTSPLLGNSMLDGRRFPRRTSLATSTAGSLRAHSQPARSIPTPSVFNGHRLVPTHLAEQHGLNDKGVSFMPRVANPTRPYMPYRSESGTLYDAGKKPAEFWGYYVGQSPSLLPQAQSAIVSPIPSHAGLAIHNSGLSPRLSFVNSGIPSSMSSPSLRNATIGENQNHASYDTIPEHQWSPTLRNAPLIHSPKRRPIAARDTLLNGDTFTVSTSASEDLGVDTPSTSEDQFQDFIDKFPASMNGYYTPRQVVTALPEQLGSSPIDPKPVLNGNGVREKGHNPGIDTDSEQEPYRPSISPAAAISMNGIGESMASVAHGNVNKRRVKKLDKTSLTTNGQAPHALAATTNGQGFHAVPSTPLRGPDSSSVWQTQRKKKNKAKKLVKSESDISTFNSAGGEILPLDESLRKGG